MTNDGFNEPRRVRVRLTHARTTVPRPFPTGAKKTRSEFEGTTDEAARTTKRAKSAPSAFDYLNDAFWVTFCGALDRVTLFELACASPHAASSVEFAHAPNVWWDERLFGPGESDETDDGDRDYRHVPRSYVRRLRLEKRVESPEIEGLSLEDLRAVGIDWVAEGGRLPGAFRRLIVEGATFDEINERVTPRLAEQSEEQENVEIESLVVKSLGPSEREVLDLRRFATLRSLSVEVEDVIRLLLNDVPSTLGVLNVKRTDQWASFVEAYWEKHIGIRRVSMTGVVRLAWLRVPTRLTHFHGPCIVHEMAVIGHGDPPVDEYYSNPRWEALGSTLRHLTGMTVFDGDEIYDDNDAFLAVEEFGWYHRVGKLEALETLDIAAHPRLEGTNLGAFAGVLKLSVRGFPPGYPDLRGFPRLEVFSASDIISAHGRKRLDPAAALRELSISTRRNHLEHALLTLRAPSSLRRVALAGVSIVVEPATVGEAVAPSKFATIEASECRLCMHRATSSGLTGSLVRFDAKNCMIPANFFSWFEGRPSSVERIRLTNLGGLLLEGVGRGAVLPWEEELGIMFPSCTIFNLPWINDNLDEIAPRLRDLEFAESSLRVDRYPSMRLPPTLRKFRWMVGVENVPTETRLPADALPAGLESLFSAQIVEGAFPAGSRLSRLEYFLPLLAHSRDSDPVGFAKFLDSHDPARFRLPKELPPFLRTYGTDALRLSPGDEARMPEEVLADVLILEEGLKALPASVVADRLDVGAAAVPEGLQTLALGRVDSELVFPPSTDVVRVAGGSTEAAKVSLPSHAVLLAPK